MPPREKPPEQIPWAADTKVSSLSDFSAWFEQTWRDRKGNEAKSTAEVYAKDFEWSVTLDSRADILDHMDLDKSLTRSIQEFWDEDKEEHYTSSFRDRIERWLKGGSRRGVVRLGPKEWRPERKNRGPVGELIEDYGYGYGNTYNEDPAFWWGDMFEYASVKFEDGEEGAIILWNTSGGPMGGYSMPQVYVGDFEEFMSLQSEGDPYSYETFLSYNRRFENAFMWGFEKLGVFEDWDAHILDYDDRRVRGVLQAIEEEPVILLPESVAKILENGVEEYPKEIRKAVTWLMAHKRRELEKALGQKLLWEDVYGE